MKAIVLYCRLTTAVSFWVAMLCAALAFIIVPSILYEVISRYFFDNPTSWAMPLSSLLLGPYFMLAGPYLLHTKGHVNVDILYASLGARAKAVADCLIYLIIIAFFCVLFQPVWEFAYSSFVMRETLFSTWSAPIWPFKLVIPAAFILMIAQSLVEFLRGLLKAVGHPDPMPPKQEQPV